MFFGGTSKSAAIITGILSKEMQYINIDIVNNILSCLSKLHNWDIDSDRVIAEDFRKYNTEKGKERKYSKEKYITVYKCICNVINIEHKVDFFLSLPENNIYLDGNECYSLITTLEKEFNLKINVENIYYTSIYSFNSILDLFFER